MGVAQAEGDERAVVRADDHHGVRREDAEDEQGDGEEADSELAAAGIFAKPFPEGATAEHAEYEAGMLAKYKAQHEVVLYAHNSTR